MKRLGCVATAIVLASSPAFGQPKGLSPTFTNEEIVVTSDTSLDGSCWRLLDGNLKRYALKNAQPACIDKLGLPTASSIEVEVAEGSKEGLYTIEGKETPVKLVLGQLGPIEAPAAIDQGPFVLVLGQGDKLVRAESITKKKAKQPSSEQEQDDAELAPCDWTKHRDADVRIDLPRRSIEHAPPRNVVQPNRGLVVAVCHDRKQDVTVQWAGARGLTRAEVGPAGETRSGKADEVAQGRARRPVTVSRLPFPPRKVGSADLKIFDGTDTTEPAVMEVELEVEPLYWGSVRFGLGTLFGDWRSYEVATFSGSRTQEVREVRNTATFEFVSGFAPYLFDLPWGGRSQSGGHNVYVAPFIGFGVLGASDKGVQGLSSFHAGLELEVASNFSIAATFVYRRVRRLADGYDVGSPVAVGMTADNITTDGWEPGFGIVINASPSFLQFATGKSSPATDGGAK